MNQTMFFNESQAAAKAEFVSVLIKEGIVFVVVNSYKGWEIRLTGEF